MAFLASVLATGVALVALVNFALLLVVFRRLLIPVRRLARDAKAHSDDPSTGSKQTFTDELHELEFYSRALMSDVTRSRTDLEESQRRLVTSEKLALIGRFAASAAHEIRNPLTSMRMWLFQLKQTVEHCPASEHACAVLEGEIGRLTELSDSFLQFSRAPSLKLAARSMGEIVDSTLDLARHRLEQRHVTLKHVNGTSLPPIMADDHQLKQVLLNLISNAADATPEGGEVRVIESCEPRPDGRAEVVVRVQDDGGGIPEAVRARLFEPFVTSKPNGTGLGLAVASSIVAEHGGQLVLESSDASGTVFALRMAACGAITDG